MQHAQRDVPAILSQLGTGGAPTSIAQALAIMEQLDAALPVTDGVKWFNLLYILVTRSIDEQTPATGWADRRWLTALDIAFAQLYFDALANSYSAPAAVPGAWQALFEARDRTGVQRIQFALAGMNAHINHDLPLAVVQTCEQLHVVPARGTPEYHDYETVNGIIDALEPQALQYLATGIEGVVAQDLNAAGQVLNNWSIEVARDTAWTNAELLWQARDRPLVRDALLTVLSRFTGFAGRGLLIPV
jgi:hypothetical protein